MKNLLITGFDPFGNQSVNPSWGAVALLPETVGKFMLCKLPIPTVFGKAAELAYQKAEEIHADAILCVGLAGGRDAVTPERIAINVADARMPDNEGNRPVGQRIVPEGPAAYFSTVPVERMADAIRAAGLPGAVSNTAGTYVCNHVLYSLLHRYAGTAVKVGFLHVPYQPGQGTPCLSLSDTARALEAAIRALEEP